MPAIAARPKAHRLGPASNGVRLTPKEFDRAADYEEGWRYELINGVLVVSPVPEDAEVSPNEELGRILRNYREDHPQGGALDDTMPERIVRIGDDRRRPDRVIWTGLGRMPRKGESPRIIAEFVSRRRRDYIRDYEEKLEEYFQIPIEEYWIIDRFRRTLTVFYRSAGKVKKKVVKEGQVYRTNLLPGFELPLARLLKVADRYGDRDDDKDDDH